MRKILSNILLVIIVVLVAAMMVGCSSSNDTGYVEAVRTHAPFLDDGDTTTIEDVVNQFFTSPTWRERTGSRDLTFVDIRGIITDVDGRRLNIILTYRVTPDSWDDDWIFVDLESLEINGTVYGADAAEEFEADLFDAYIEGFNSLADFFVSYGYSQGIAQTFADYFGTVNVGGRTGSNQGSNAVHVTFGSTFEYQGIEYVIGDNWTVRIVQGMPDEIIVPIRITNISNTDSGHLFGLQTWSPEGIEIPGMMMSNLQGGLMRPGVSLDGELRFQDRGDGDYVLEILENIPNTFERHAVIIITLPITQTSSSNQTAEITPETTDQATDLDERLFGVWVEQGDFPEWVTLTRTFNPDGTGYWWGDGPGYRFTWWVEGNVLTINAIQNDIDYEWTNVFQYEIIGDTMTFTHADGWQRVYIRESAVPTNQASSNINMNLVGTWTFRMFGNRTSITFYDGGMGRLEIAEDGFEEEVMFTWETTPAFGDFGELVLFFLDDPGDMDDNMRFEIISHNQLDLWFPDEEWPITFSRE